ncbi:MAG: hypothetical protein ACXV3A_04375 [Kineosporiaceae bacterium]
MGSSDQPAPGLGQADPYQVRPSRWFAFSPVGAGVQVRPSRWFAFSGVDVVVGAGTYLLLVG